MSLTNYRLAILDALGVGIDLLRPYVHGGSMKVLELFARYVAPGPAAEKENGDDSLWFSVGNESLKYNDIGAFWIEE